MLTPRTSWRSLFVAALALASSPAQLRKPCIGTVVDADDEPIADAQVTFVWSSTPLEYGDPDHLCVTTDARGRFVANLRTGDVYTAWVVGPADGKGRRAVSEPADSAAAGRVLRLVCASIASPRQLALPNVQAWSADGARRVRVRPDVRHHAGDTVAIGADDTVMLPVLPWATAAVDLLDARGGVIQTVGLAPDADPVVVRFHPPREVPVLAVDDESVPLPGVDVAAWSVHVGPRPSGDRPMQTHLIPTWRTAGTTDANGRAVVRVPFRETKSGAASVRLRASARGRRSAYATWLGGNVDVVRLTLSTDAPIAIACKGLRPGEQCQVHLTSAARSGSGTLPVEVAAVSRGDGELVVEGYPAEALGAVARLRLSPSPDAREMPTLRHVVTAGVMGIPETMAIDLRRMRSCAVTVVDPAGALVPGALLAVAECSDAMPVYWQACFATDPAGRAEVLFPEGAWFVYAVLGLAHGLAVVEPEAKAGPVQIALQPIPTTRLRVLDADETPVHLAQFRAQRVTWGGGGGGGADEQLNRVVRQGAMYLVDHPRSTRDGWLVVPAFEVPGLEISGLVQAGSAKSEPFTLPAAGREQTVVLR